MKFYWQYSILYISTAGMEACWLFALLSLLNKHIVNESLSVIYLLLLFPLAFVVNKLIQQLKWSKVMLLGLSWLICILFILLMVKIQLFNHISWFSPAWLWSLLQSITQVLNTFKPEILILISSPVLWWLGRRLAYQKVDFSLLVSEFQFGLIIMIIIFAITSALEIELISAVPITVFFFIFALSGISIAHAREDINWISEIQKGHWLWLLIIGISLILIIGVLIGTLVSPNLLQLIIAALKWIWALILNFMAFLASLLPEPGAAELPPDLVPPLPNGDSNAELFRLETMSESLKTFFNILMGVIWVGLIVGALWQISSQIFKWLQRKLTSTAGMEVETLSGAFKADIIGLLKSIISILLRTISRLRLSRKSVSAYPEVVSVRQTYANMLRWAAKKGYPRYAYQTPYDYLKTLLNLLPEAYEDLNYVTEQYVDTRYGTSIPSTSELNKLNQSWQRIRQNRFQKSRGKHIIE